MLTARLLPAPALPTRRARSAARPGAAAPRDAAIIAVLLDAGARVQECACLDAGDFAITARTGEIRLHGKGDEVRRLPRRPARAPGG